MIRLAECTWPKAQRLARDERALVILPLGRGGAARAAPAPARRLARRRGDRAAHRAASDARGVSRGAGPGIALRGEPARRALARHGVAVARHARARDRRGGARPRAATASGASSSPTIRPTASTCARWPRRARRLRGVQVLFAGFSPDAGRVVADGEPARPRAHAESRAGPRVAFGRARDRADAGAPAGPGAPVAGSGCRPRGWTSAARSRGVPGASRTSRPAAPATSAGPPRRGRRRPSASCACAASSSPARCSRSSGVRAPRRSTATRRVAARELIRRARDGAPSSCRARRPRGWYCSAVGRGRGVAVARGRGKECS